MASKTYPYEVFYVKNGKEYQWGFRCRTLTRATEYAYQAFDNPLNADVEAVVVKCNGVSILLSTREDADERL